MIVRCRCGTQRIGAQQKPGGTIVLICPHCDRACARPRCPACAALYDANGAPREA